MVECLRLSGTGMLTLRATVMMVVLCAPALFGCATSPTHVDRDSVSWQYDPMLYSLDDIQAKADQQCKAFGRHAVLESQYDGRGLGMKGATFRCAD